MRALDDGVDGIRDTDGMAVSSGPDGTAAVGRGQQIDWLYARIYCAGGDDTDALMPRLAHWLDAVRAHWPIRSAHFLRFVDLRGHHLRLRVQAAPDTLDEVFARLDILDAAARRAPVRALERLVSDPLTSGGGSGRPGVACAVYGPEYAKYGGPKGAEGAESHFDISSRWCLDNRVWKVPRPVGRVGLVARLLANAAVAGPLPADELLAAHLRMWGYRLPERLRDGAALGAVVRQVLEFPLNRTPGWEHADELTSQVADDAARTVGRIGAGAGGRRALDLLHIDANRLGVNPAEECVAGVCARYLLGGPGVAGASARG
ncbi:lantibiotic dehydratase C-terminal domain-containing protein [uncultured Actinomyces sp.]|uniref:lantibiotic dehydratase C-terminal domain-containing protein n=1 Tax=uncultured Actinomyces sp. TaxID=249061 RepID=UPI0028EF35E4|nr:lantibiotic dehydratase C-terminal domain-containing protein [uncultured Actinomyces sp.]